MPYREGKKWRGVVTIRGKRIAQRLFPTKREAAEWEMAEKKRILSQTHIISLHEAATKYLDFCEARFTKTTYGDKRCVLRDLMSATGNVPLDSITPDIILELLLAKDSNNLYNRTRKDLHAFFNHCLKFHGLEKNPVAEIDTLPVERKPQPVPTEEEVVRLLMAADRHDRNLIIACCTTGGRRSEIFRWRWHEDINFEKRTVRLGTRKTRSGDMKHRWTHMNEMLFDALQDQWRTKLPHTDYVFQNRDRRHPRYGDRYTTRRRFMKGLCKRAGVRPVGFHSLRRFFGSLLADKYKESIPTIQKLLGHASPNTTERYIYNISHDAKRAVEQIKFEIKIPEEIPEQNKRS
jgi:integrase